MAYNWKAIWLLVIIVLGALLLTVLHRQRYLEFSPGQTYNQQNAPPPQDKSNQQKVNVAQIDQNINLQEKLSLRDKQIIENNEEIAKLKESISKLQKSSSSKPPGSSSPTSNVMYNCKKGLVPPQKSELATMDHNKLAELYHNYVENIQVSCNHMRRMGNQGDGGWEVCDDEAVRPKQTCLVYSVGINNDFTFDDAVGKHYGCEIHAFDPSMNKPDHKHSDKVMFHNLGLADFDGTSNNKWKMATLNTIRKTLNHSQKTIDILKIDIEQWEMKVFPEMLRTNALKDVTQFVMEMHISLQQRDGTKEHYITALGILRDLYDQGFRIFFTHRNRWSYFNSAIGKVQRTACHELNLMKVC